MKTKVFNLIILDESGSMSCMEKQTIDGCNETLNTIVTAQKKFAETQDYYVSIYAFQSNESKPSHYLIKNMPIAEAKHITGKDYEPWGGTPLYDAVGSTLSDLKKKVEREESAIGSVTIITDGAENCSIHYTGNQVAKMIAELKEMGWNFNFIGANIDVESVASSLNIENYLAFEQTEEEVDYMFEKERNSRLGYYSRLNEAVNECASPKMRRASFKKAAKGYFDAPRITPEKITRLQPNEIFVFGSNLAGHHAGGAAFTAVQKFGAVMGQGVGLQGNSYAIPTMQGGIDTIRPYVDDFLHFAETHPELTFFVTRIGCGIAGFKDREIAPLFTAASKLENVYLPETFWKVFKH